MSMSLVGSQFESSGREWTRLHEGCSLVHEAIHCESLSKLDSDEVLLDVGLRGLINWIRGSVMEENY